ncbi:MAG: class I SAM-dependent methyltransferase [Candidatus Omnitrophota bacterium]|nr:MAG: class I SAM-dependent methyltransferase [Candidatus Omnitrophota bacterium]
MNIDYLNFCPRLKDIFMSGFSINSKGEKIRAGGFSTFNNIIVIREILKKMKPNRTLEIGLAYGASTLTILTTLKEIFSEGFLHTAIDPFENIVWKGSALRVIEEEGYSEHFRFFEYFSSLKLASLVKEKEKFDFIYVDGSHLFEDVFLDFYYSVSLLNKNGIVLFDDCTNKHIEKVIKFIIKNYSSILKPLDIRPFEDKKKSIKKKIANKLGIRQLVGFKKISEPPRKWNSKFRNF